MQNDIWLNINCLVLLPCDWRKYEFILNNKKIFFLHQNPLLNVITQKTNQPYSA